MSKKEHRQQYLQVYPSYYRTNCLCDLRELTILILVVLQFTKSGKSEEEFIDIDNDILFIIAMYFLTCLRCRRDFQFSFVPYDYSY